LLLSDKSLRLLVIEPIDRKWLHKALSSSVVRGQLSAMATGTSDSMRNVSQDKIESVVLPLPPLDEQHQIAETTEDRLSVVDQLSAQVEADLKRAARLRQGILKRAFEGRLVPQDPADEPAAVLLERIRASNGTMNRADGSRTSASNRSGKSRTEPPHSPGEKG
jgi:type I restriction enzyme S subunit